MLPSAIFWSLDNICASFCCLSANSPRPLKSTRNKAIMESTICRGEKKKEINIWLNLLLVKTENWWKLSCQERNTVTNKKFENSGFFIKFRCNKVHQFILVLAWKMKLIIKYFIANLHEVLITHIFS